MYCTIQYNIILERMSTIPSAEQTELQAKIHRKHRQRMVEYGVLVCFHWYAVVVFTPMIEGGILLAAPVLIGGGMGVQLAMYRERRRLRHPLDPKRLIAESVESLSMMLMVVLILIIAVQTSLPLAQIMGWLSSSLLGYFAGTMLGEYLWRQRILVRLREIACTRYEENLTRSVIFPYNLKLITRLFSKPTHHS